jgi:hypothetical protein
MNRLVVFSLFLLLFVTAASPGFGQADVIIKNKAKAIRDANNARQGIEPNQPLAPAAPAPGQGNASATNAPHGIDPAQQANIDKLAEDLAAIKAGVRVPLDQRAEIQTNVLALAKGTVKPSGQSVTNLVKSLSLALAGSGVGLKEGGSAQIARSINVVVNSVNLSPSQVQPVIIAARNALLTGGVPEDDYKPVVTDMNAIVTELHKSKPKPSP